MVHRVILVPPCVSVVRGVWLNSRRFQIPGSTLLQFPQVQTGFSLKKIWCSSVHSTQEEAVMWVHRLKIAYFFFFGQIVRSSDRACECPANGPAWGFWILRDIAWWLTLTLRDICGTLTGHCWTSRGMIGRSCMTDRCTIQKVGYFVEIGGQRPPLTLLPEHIRKSIDRSSFIFLALGLIVATLSAPSALDPWFPIESGGQSVWSVERRQWWYEEMIVVGDGRWWICASEVRRKWWSDGVSKYLAELLYVAKIAI
jgi:hypothetical protein